MQHNNMDTFVTIPHARWVDLNNAAGQVESLRNELVAAELNLHHSEREWAAKLTRVTAEKSPQYSRGIKYRLEAEGDMFRLYALRDIKEGVLAGEAGGLVYGSRALDQDGECWIGNGVVVKDQARVRGDAVVSGSGIVLSGRCLVGKNARVDNAMISQSAHIEGYANVTGGKISGNVVVRGETRIEDSVLEHGYFNGVAELYGARFLGESCNAIAVTGGRFPEDAIVHKREDVLQIISRWGMVTLVRTAVGHVITIGCTDFQLEDLADALENTGHVTDYDLLQLEGFQLMASKLIESWDVKVTDTDTTGTPDVLDVRY